MPSLTKKRKKNPSTIKSTTIKACTSKSAKSAKLAKSATILLKKDTETMIKLRDYVKKLVTPPPVPSSENNDMREVVFEDIIEKRRLLSQTKLYSNVICDVLDEIKNHGRVFLSMSSSSNLCTRLNKYYKLQEHQMMFTDGALVSRYIRPNKKDVDGCKFSIFSILQNESNFNPNGSINIKKLAENVLTAIHSRHQRINVINDTFNAPDKKETMIDNISELIKSYSEYMLTPKLVTHTQKDIKIIKQALPKLSLSVSLTPLCNNLKHLLNLEIRSLGERLNPDQQQTHIDAYFRNRNRCYLTLCDINRFNLEHKLNVAMLTFTFGLFSRVKGKSAKALLQGGYSPIKYVLGCMSLAPSEAAPNLRKSDFLFVIYHDNKFIVDKELWLNLMGYSIPAETEEHFQIIADLFNLVMIRLFEYYRTHAPAAAGFKIEPIQLFIILSVCLFFTNTPFPLIYMMFKNIDIETQFNNNNNNNNTVSTHNSQNVNKIFRNFHAVAPTHALPAVSSSTFAPAAFAPAAFATAHAVAPTNSIKSNASEKSSASMNLNSPSNNSSELSDRVDDTFDNEAGEFINYVDIMVEADNAKEIQNNIEKKSSDIIKYDEKRMSGCSIQ
jgi:hypothetical protein